MKCKRRLLSVGDTERLSQIFSHDEHHKYERRSPATTIQGSRMENQWIGLPGETREEWRISKITHDHNGRTFAVATSHERTVMICLVLLKRSMPDIKRMKLHRVTVCKTKR
jgi:hypothetical protein